MNEQSRTVPRGQEFAELAKRILIAGEGDGRKKYSVKAAADRMGIGRDALYKRLDNQVAFSADEIRALIGVTAEPRFVTYLLHRTPFTAADRVEPDNADEVAVHRSTTRVAIEASDVLEAVETALADDRICNADAMMLVPDLEKAERALASLRLRMRELAPLVARDKL